MTTTGDDLMMRFIPVIPGYVAKRFARLSAKDCLFALEDLTQVAMIEMMKLAREWTGRIDGRDVSGDEAERIFFSRLKLHVKWAIHDYADDISPRDRAKAASIEEEEEADPRTSIRARSESNEWPIIRDEIMDFFDVLPARQKVILALRYIDGLSVKTVARLLETTPASIAHISSRAIDRWRLHTRNQWSSTPTEVESIIGRKWEPPATLLEYFEARHRKDMPEYIWFAATCFRADVGYLTDILGESYTYSVENAQYVLSPAQEVEADRRLRAGETQAAIARDFGVNTLLISRYARRRARV